MKKLFAVAVALSLAVSVAHASWGYDPVNEHGEGQATFGYYGGGFGLKLRYSPAVNLEIFSANGIAGIGSDYVVGVRYQIIPLLVGSLDFGIPTAHNNFGLMPSVALHTNLTDMISLGVKAGLGIDIVSSYTIPAPTLEDPNASIPMDGKTEMNLVAGIEFGFTFNENMGMWVGTGFEYADMTADGAELDMKAALSPEIGIWFAEGKIGVATMLGLILDHTNRSLEESIGFWGGVEVTVGF
ncbi:MAG: hypothetical protein LBU70_00705 [Chitinispirillales bacterium]|jgi:hypothetical protein|nr:hypothetical protein [Chitinispirillales bacterium]